MITLQSSWIAETSAFIHLAKLQSKSGVSVTIGVLVGVTKTGSNCNKLPLQATEEDEETQEVTASLAGAKEFGMDAAVAGFIRAGWHFLI